MLDVEKALKELETTSMEKIETLTAKTWGARAVASYRLAGEEDDLETRLRRFYEGENFRQEAFEHASMADDDGHLLQEIREEIDGVRSTSLSRLEQVVRAV